jgi:His-Xaa-Ser system radical SAM maturase HxsB
MGATLPVLNRRFNSYERYDARSGSTYTLLPFRFLPLDDKRHIVTNLAGEHLVVPRDVVQDLVRKRLPLHSALYNELKAKHFLLDGDSSVALDLLAAKYRTKRVPLSNFTALHMFVVTLRCDHSCPYCQVSRQSEDRAAFDMTEAMADRAIGFLFRSPSPTLKVEFQGGEPLLNFDLIKYIVRQVEQRNSGMGRSVEFVIATNLSPLTDEHLQFCLEHDVFISTSLDGPAQLHNANRPRPGRDSYERTVKGIERVREALGPHKISALMTTTAASLAQPTEIIDEYLRQGFGAIFLRPISPYGFAVKTRQADSYQMDQWLDFYKKGLAYVLSLNCRGIDFREHYAALILRKMLTPYGTAYVDLQSPAGIGIGAVAFNYDGDVYPSDEARMLMEMGDRTFRLGNLFENTYEEIMTSDALLGPLTESMAECVPCCSDCGVQPYCGSDPVHHHRMFGDPVGFKPSSAFCRKNMGVIRHIVTLLEDDPKAAEILRGWAQ